MPSLPRYADIFGDSEAPPVAVVMGSEHYNALALIRALGRQGVPVVAAGTSPGAAGLSSRFAREKAVYPDLNSDPDAALEVFVEVCRKCGSRGERPLLIPTGDRHVQFLSRFRERFDGIAVIHLPDDRILEAIMDKAEQYAHAESLGISYPRTWGPSELPALREQVRSGEVEFPLIFKASTVLPEYHQNQTFRRVPLDAMPALEALVARASELDLDFVIQEIIPGEDDRLFTVGSVMNEEGEMTGVFTGRKLRQMPPGFGVCRVGESCDEPEIVEASRRLLRSFNFFGISQVEFKHDSRDGRFKLMEINPRSWSWIGLSIKVGVNLPYLYFLDAFGVKEIPQVNQAGKNALWISVWDDLLHSIRHGDKFPLSALLDGYDAIYESHWDARDPLPAFRYARRMLPLVIKMIGKKVLRKLK